MTSNLHFHNQPSENLTFPAAGIGFLAWIGIHLRNRGKIMDGPPDPKKRLTYVFAPSAPPVIVGS